MRKLVNGKVIEVDNIELFELAAEGLALQSTAVSNTSDGIEANINSPLVRRYIKQYDIFFKAMPYPLYAIESDIKYATLGNFIKSFSKDKITMWVDGGLHIKLDEESGMTLKIVNNTWSIIYVKDSKPDNTAMEYFEKSVGYKEYSWLLNKVKNKENTANFYLEFMPEFIKACNSQSMILKWELENILTFGIIPNRMEFKINKIICPQNNEEYSLDIFYTGTIDTDEKISSWSISGTECGAHQRYKQIKTYGFDAYVKSLSTDATGDGAKTKGCRLNGLHNLFMQLCGIKSACEMQRFPDFQGIIVDTNLVFTIDKRLFLAKSSRLVDPIDIAHGVELYSVENNKIYFTKSKKVTDRVTKETLYSYNISTGSIRLCKILYTY
jgi:hypothetical protein